MKILNDAEIKKELETLPGWKREENKIVKQFEFKNFLDALNFINGLAPFFQENDHHPDINWSYKKITFSLTRYDAGEKLTDMDFITAREIEKRFLEKEGKKV